MEDYRLLNYLDEPPRFFGFTKPEVIIVLMPLVISLVFTAFGYFKLGFFSLILMLVNGILLKKYGNLIPDFDGFVYWHFPQLGNNPFASYKRLFYW